MDTLIYRKATALDAAAIRELSLASYNQFATVLSPEHWEKMRQGLSDDVGLQQLMDSATTFVCDTGSELVGVVFLVSSGNPTPVYPADWAYIRRLGVHPAFRGRAIARRLMEVCIKEARLGAERILGLHTSTIMPDARHLYERLGFLQVRELAPLSGQQYWLYRLDLRP